MINFFIVALILFLSLFLGIVGSIWRPLKYPPVALIFFLALLLYVVGSVWRPLKYPPGPAWLPITGNLLQLKKLAKQFGGQHIALWKLAQQYSTNVLGLKLGKDYIVVVFSYDVVKKVLTGEEYEGRPDNFFLRLRTMGTRKGVVCTDGEFWRIQRSFITTHLRELGFGKKSMEDMVKEEILEVLNLIQEKDKDIRIGSILAPAVINILWTLTAGNKISRNDPRLKKLLELLATRSKLFDMSGGILSQHPWLRHIAPEKTGYNLILRMNKQLENLLMETINEHYHSWYENRKDDLVHAFITEMRKTEKSTFTEDQLIMVCLDMFIAGAQTTSNTLDFAFLAMILYPDIQKAVQESLDREFGLSETINYSDRNKVPYIEAVLLEVQRVFCVIPTVGPRRVLRDTQLDKFVIPKNTTVLISSYSVHNDKELWKDPENFRPERFLDGNGKIVLQDRVLQFGLGRRRCLGEVLARQCIFLFFVEILRKYQISLAPGAPELTGIPLPGLTLSPELYSATFIKREPKVLNN